MHNIYFFDSYALAEISLGNPNYKNYIKSGVVLTKLNLFEIYYGLLRDVGEKEAKNFLERYYQFSVDFYKEDIQEAAKLKLKLKKKNVSMTDCIGYAVAKRLNIRFLTGDKEFEYLDNVEFVK